MKKGFTIVELLVSVAIMALIIAISIPAYEGISYTIKEQSRNSKITMIKKSTESYINKYHKDKVFNGSSQTICYTIDYLIGKNIILPDNKTDDGITDPLNNEDLNGYFVASYDDEKDFKVNIEYETQSVSCSDTYNGDDL